MATDAVRDDELRIGIETQELLDQPHFGIAERFAMHFLGIVLCGEPYPIWLGTMISDGRSPPRGFAIRAIELIQIVGVADVHDMPAIGEEACRDVLGEGELVLPSKLMRLLS